MNHLPLDPSISSLWDLRKRAPDSPTRVTLIQPELSGGKITRSEIDALLSRGASIVTVSGLDQDTFEYMVRRYGEQLVALHFWKCPRIDDFSPLEGVGKLTFAAFYWNQKATRFWNFSRTPSLSGLFFENFKKVEDLADLADASSLRELEFGNGFTGRSVVHSLEPLARLKALRSLAINPSRVLEGGIFPLASLVSLTDLSFSQRLFPVEQIAWLRARLPATLQSEALTPTRPVPIKGVKLPGDLFVNGKGGPLLSADKDVARVRRFVAQFEALVQMYRDNPELRPEA